MAEEHRCQAPRLCVNNCGFFGSPTTQNLCSKCFRDLQLKAQQSSSAKHALNQTLISSSSSSPSPSVDLSLRERPATDVEVAAEAEKPPAEVASPVQSRAANRCMTCRRRVGLTGFKCRCGSVFCGTHRYPEQHACSFDFKEMGKEQIAKANPVVKAEKLQKI
ncbi:hypothetical protein AB3S75_039626 [Citrus x aurantiifolia]